MTEREIKLLSEQLDYLLSAKVCDNVETSEIAAKKFKLEELEQKIITLEAELAKNAEAQLLAPSRSQALHYCNEFFRRVGIECDCEEMNAEELEMRLKSVYRKYK